MNAARARKAIDPRNHDFVIDEPNISSVLENNPFSKKKGSFQKDPRAVS